METMKNIQFTKLIKADGQLREFNFHRSANIDGPIFTVDVADMKGQRHYVLFKLDHSEWKLKTSHFPGWIGEVLPILREAIEGVVA